MTQSKNNRTKIPLAEFLRGVRAELPILVGVAPFGMIFGVLALEAGFTVPVRLEGGNGNDVLDAAAFSGSATLDGGFGNDTLLGGPGDTVYVETPGSTDTVTDTGGRIELAFPAKGP